ncbi:MAG TPA: extracellular solute-binding protein [Candidatus Methylomirabilis sp.]|jgi:ABC-type Fe3+ transport system substrate-binding protein|nr:extracellular solute-binding protein [Candidatus Methylomirabilis sp.]
MRRIRTALLGGLALALAVGLVPGMAAAQAIEDELVLITPVSKFIHDAALKAFAEYAKETWNVTVKVNALAAGTPVAYGRIVEWKGRPEVDIFWGGESALFDKLTDQKLLSKLDLSKASWDAIPVSVGKPKPIPLKDPRGYWVGTALEPYGLVYHPRVLKRLGVPDLKTWDDLLDPRLKGNVAQCAPTRSSSSNATYEVILQSLGEEKGWDWLKKLAGNSGIFTARSRDVPSVVAKGEFAAGFAVPSYMAFEERLAGFDIKFVAPQNAFVTPEPMAILAGAKHPKAAAAFIEFLLTERGQRVFMERGLFPITPKYRVQGAPGSPAEMAVEFTGGVRSYFESDVSNVYDDAIANKRSESLKAKYRAEIEAKWEELKKAQ